MNSRKAFFIYYTQETNGLNTEAFAVGAEPDG